MWRTFTLACLVGSCPKKFKLLSWSQITLCFRWASKNMMKTGSLDADPNNATATITLFTSSVSWNPRPAWRIISSLSSSRSISLTKECLCWQWLSVYQINTCRWAIEPVWIETRNLRSKFSVGFLTSSLRLKTAHFWRILHCPSSSSPSR
jgi:hypothetical protein